MKPTVLKIGDWVRLIADEDPEQHSNQRVTAITKDFFDGDNVRLDVPDDEFWLGREIEPIPLTKEILEKNGFKADKHLTYLYSLEDVNDWFVLDMSNNKLYRKSYSPERGSNYDYYELFPIRFVHEFQQVLWMLCIEKEIKP